jgi:hypothetical protein
MIVAMAGMRVMKAAVDEKIDMIAMRHGLVAAPRPMRMARFVTGMSVLRSAMVRVDGVYFDHMFIHMIVMRMVEMTIMQIIDVVAMANRNMAASRSVLMRMIGMSGVVVFGHRLPFPFPFPFPLSKWRIESKLGAAASPA